MRDGTVGGNGFGTASNPDNLGWDEGLYRDDARSYAPGADDSYALGADDPASGGEEPPGRIPEPRGAGSGGGHRRGGPRRRPKSRRKRILKWVSIGLAVAVLGTAGAAYGYYEYLSGKIRKGERVSGSTNVAKTKANANGDTPMNILILGSDSRNDAEDLKLGGARSTVGEPPRADVIMIAHLSADRSNMSVVSIPRDTRVNIPQCTDPKTHKVYAATNAIINESLGRGGAGCTLATVQNLTGVYIDHWLTIDFSGVVKMADVVGGVEVCVKENVDDHSTPAQPGGSHLHLKAGKQKVYGETALQWLRTRHAWGSDAMRAKAQHMYMSSLIRQLRSQNLFTNPGKLNKIATTAMSAFEVSKEIGTPKKLYDLGMELKTVPSNRITMLTMPHDADPEAPDAHYIPSADAAQVWSLLRNDVAMDANGKAKTPASGSPSAKPTTSAPSGPPAAAAGTIPVTVVNGTAGTSDGVPTGHRAGDIATALQGAGFTQAKATQEAKPSPGTRLVYPTSGGAQGKADATAVAKALKIPAANVKADADVSAITLTIGADWKTGTDFSKTLPKSGSVPTTADATNGADTTGCMEVLPIYRW
ncbi:transcriptional attenuator, LytR family [Actinacidiphila alni]|uniref:Transcriptional attenuator, LytR family n=1 Tax=Actinacidiphila alni TaxID=380248 RepID=A0A1I2FQU6_9ACTN|nr:LCP family protein [Actinacidiphila alni]SFF07842.1 transcriptional attenuator, LytR family [Actinacidiphila alni]